MNHEAYVRLVQATERLNTLVETLMPRIDALEKALASHDKWRWRVTGAIGLALFVVGLVKCI